jgi:Phage integrase, N-terminal SAM-like domain
MTCDARPCHHTDTAKALAFNNKRNVGHVMKDTAAQIDTSLTITLARPPLPADFGADGWADVSTVVVQRFLDSYWVKHGVSRETLEAYRVDLVALHGWVKQTKARSLVTATSDDIRDFLAARSQATPVGGQGLPSLSCIKRFYSYLLVSGYRSDDPTESVFVRTPRLVRRDLAA